MNRLEQLAKVLYLSPEEVAQRLELLSESERLGAENAQLGRVNFGDNAGQFIYTLTFASGEVYGKFMDAGATDSEWMALWAEAIKKQSGTMSNSRLINAIDI